MYTNKSSGDNTIRDASNILHVFEARGFLACMDATHVIIPSTLVHVHFWSCTIPSDYFNMYLFKYMQTHHILNFAHFVASGIFNPCAGSLLALLT